MIDILVVVVLDMYVELDCVRQVGVIFIGEVCWCLGVCCYVLVVIDLVVQW